VLERFFRYRERGGSLRGEALGGLTTFVTMAYIVVVNPAVLAYAGLPVGPSTLATILVAALFTLLMGLHANRPIAVAPYMGENAFIAFGLTALGATWRQALGAVFVSGVAFLLLTLLGLRGRLATAISPSLKRAFAVGIGLFLTLIGLYETGIVTSFVTGLPAAALSAADGVLLAPAAPLKIGRLGAPSAWLAVLGVLLIATLLARRVPGGILLGMAGTAALGIALGHAAPPRALFAIPFSGDYVLGPIALQADVVGVLRLAYLPVLLTLFLMSFLDTLGTLLGVGAAGGMLDERGQFPEIEKPMLVDAAACTAAGLLGTSTSGAYIESAAGIREGARSGLAAVVTALLFGASLFLLPLVEWFQTLRFAWAPALVAVGLLMLGEARGIDYDDPTEVFPAFATVAMMAFTYSIGNGLTAGLLLYPLMKVATGRAREVTGGAWTLFGASALYYFFGLPH
jgi:AGZA family xanthine/uracil permease-like MFS transporter